jgi:hypothetical protein
MAPATLCAAPDVDRAQDGYRHRASEKMKSREVV